MKIKVRAPNNTTQTPLTTLLGDSLASESLCAIHKWLPTGAPSLDWAISGKVVGGGIPVGRLVECYGGTSTGKTLLAMELAVSAQKQGYDVLYYDTEAAFSHGLFVRLGGEPSTVVYRTPDTVEELFDDMEVAIKKRAAAGRKNPLLIVWDSIAASSSREEMAKSYDDNMSPATHARKISQAFRKLARQLPQHQIAMFATNQQRQKIGPYAGWSTFGGLAVGFYSSVRIELHVEQKLIVNKRVVGITVRAEVDKNKVAIPYLVARFDIRFNRGIDRATSAFNLACVIGSATRRGSWYDITLRGKTHSFQAATWPVKVWQPHQAEVLAKLHKDGVAYLEGM